MDKSLSRGWSGVPAVALGLLAAFVAAVAGVYLGPLLAVDQFTYRQVIMLSMVLCLVVVLLGGRKGIHWGTLAWVGSFILGFRYSDLTPEFKLHPAEVLLWALFAGLLISRALPSGRPLPLWMPRWIWMFIPFWLWGFGPWLPGSPFLDRQLSEFRCFVLLIPLSIVLGHVLEDRRNWRPILVTFYIAGTVIAFLGAAEHMFPGIIKFFPAYIHDVTPIDTDEGFNRARFSFWGNPAATYTCIMAVPLLRLFWRWWPTVGMRALLLAAAALQIWGIYIGGYRSLWMLGCLQVLLFILMSKRYVTAVAITLIVIASYPRLPAPTRGRIDSLVRILERRPSDTSGVKRLGRTEYALRSIQEHPLGQGWATAGWVHDDFLQVAANLGLLAGIYFTFAYLWTLIRLWWRVRSSRAPGGPDPLGTALLLGFIAAGGIMGMEVVIVLPHLVMPVWFMWVLAEVWLRETSAARRKTDATHLGSVADIQLPGHGERHAGVGEVGG